MKTKQIDEVKKSGTDVSTIHQRREYHVVKHNDLIQKSRYSLTAQESKVLLFAISQIKPDGRIEPFTVSIRALCEICAIEYNGKNYRNLRDTVKSLADKSFWIKDGNTETLYRWIDKAVIDTESLNITLRLSEDLAPYLTQVNENFTNYMLTYVLGMKSKYSIRLYELLRSRLNLHRWAVPLDELKKQLNSADYPVYQNFKARVLDVATAEINELTDLKVEFAPVRRHRKITDVCFYIEYKEPGAQLDAMMSRQQRYQTDKYTEEREKQDLWT